MPHPGQRARSAQGPKCDSVPVAISTVQTGTLTQDSARLTPDAGHRPLCLNYYVRTSTSTMVGRPFRYTRRSDGMQLSMSRAPVPTASRSLHRTTCSSAYA